jgi:tRNA-dihydrouridine synthase A
VYFHRLLTRRTRLYTEMVTTGALLPWRRAAGTWISRGRAPAGAAARRQRARRIWPPAARLAQEWGYDEVNLNCGCPSERVQRGAFGACLMAEPALVADCVAAMVDAVGGIPVTVKHRIGIDRVESYDFVRDFVGRWPRPAAGCSSCMPATPGCRA